MSYTTLLVDVDDHGIATVTINRPDKLNALNADVIDDLDAFFSRAETDASIKGVILTGSGEKSFVPGADIARFRDLAAAKILWGFPLGEPRPSCTAAQLAEET